MMRARRFKLLAGPALALTSLLAMSSVVAADGGELAHENHRVPYEETGYELVNLERDKVVLGSYDAAGDEVEYLVIRMEEVTVDSIEYSGSSSKEDELVTETIGLVVQYRESDLSFVDRLMEEEGIYYFFDHDGSADDYVLVLGDDGDPEDDD